MQVRNLFGRQTVWGNIDCLARLYEPNPHLGLCSSLNIREVKLQECGEQVSLLWMEIKFTTEAQTKN